MPKICFFVFGAEGSGTYMLAESLVFSGCIYDDDPFQFVHSNDDKKVVRISFPHAGSFHEPHKITEKYEQDGYTCFSLPIFRDFFASVLSVKRRDPSRTIESIKSDHLKACKYLSMALAYENVMYINYQPFVTYQKYRKSLFEELGLPEPKSKIFFNANQKYYA